MSGLSIALCVAFLFVVSWGGPSGFPVELGLAAGLPFFQSNACNARCKDLEFVCGVSGQSSLALQM